MAEWQPSLGFCPPGGSVEWLPPWISELGLAVWVLDSAGKLVYLDARAEELLGWQDGAWYGRGLHEVVCGAGGSAESCAQDCLIVRRVLAPGVTGHEPTMVRCGLRSGRGRWLLVFSARVEAEDGGAPLVLQLGHDTSRIHVIVEYLARLATRSTTVDAELVPPHEALSPREREILRHLAHDEDPQRIALLLHVSSTTVRNHVRHILHKLGVHSVQEAIALHLMKDPPSSESLELGARSLQPPPPDREPRAGGWWKRRS